MISMMHQFVNYLRFRGIEVSTSSLHNAIDALQWIDPLDKRQVYVALEACIVQNEDDRKRFRTAFDTFFQSSRSVSLEAQDVAFKMQVKEFINEVRKEGDYIGKIMSDYLDGEIVGFMANAGEEEDTYRPVYTDVTSGLGMSKEEVREKIKKRIQSLSDKAVDFANGSFHMHREKREELADYLRKLLEEAEELMDNKPAKDHSRNHLLPWEKQRSISSITFDKLSLEEIEKVKAEVERIAQKLKDALSRQKKRAQQGHIDIKNTIRASMKFGGIPFKVKKRKPNRKKGKIIAICDISMSMAYAAQFMLLMLYRLQKRFSKIRTFVFIRNTYEISHYFNMYPLETALQKAIKTHHIGMGQLTNYGYAFRSFLDGYSKIINKDTTILILGDALSNQTDPKVEALEEMSRKAARTIWLNPEEEKYWYSPTSSIRDYKPYCTQMVECATIDQLSEFAKKLVL